MPERLTVTSPEDNGMFFLIKFTLRYGFSLKNCVLKNLF